MDSFIIDDLAESFYEVLIIWGSYSSNLVNIVDVYEPDTIINENAERCDRFQGIVNAAAEIIMLEEDAVSSEE